MRYYKNNDHDKGDTRMEKGKPHIEYDDFGAYEEYLEDICTGKGQDHGFVRLRKRWVPVNEGRIGY